MLVSAAALLVVYSLLLCPSGAHDNSLELWIEGHEMRKISGATTDLQLVTKGRSNLLLTSSESQLTLPEHKDSLRFKWQAPPGYKYSIDQLMTSGDSGLSSPYLSIPHAGDVPHVESEFQLWLPCEDSDGEMKSVYISLIFTNTEINRHHSKPVTMLINKRCNLGTAIPCRHTCENGGSCGKYGVCECRDGYYGPACKQVLCVPHCYNSGTCIKPGVCACIEGFSGKICEKAFCKKNCSNHGRCIGPDKCKCQKQWTGKYCQKQLTSEVYAKFYKMTRAKRKSSKTTKIHSAVENSPK